MEHEEIGKCRWCGATGKGFADSEKPSDYCGHDPALVRPAAERPHGVNVDADPVSPSGGVWVEWEHRCSRQGGARVLTTKDLRCKACGLHENDRDADGVGEVPRG